MTGEDLPALDRLVAQVADGGLRAAIEREVGFLRGSRRFGLVFDRHLPESAHLLDHPIRPGVSVALRDGTGSETWRVVAVDDDQVTRDDGSRLPASDLVVVRDFRDPIYPGLRSLGRLPLGDAGEPWHTVINGENLHVLQLLTTVHREAVDLIYIDPPYNTGNDGWIYNDRYVDTSDRAKSSKWLSFMERRLEMSRDLLKATGVIIVAIGDDEHHRLRMLMDQVFGPSNFISDVVWQGGRKNDSRYVSNGADYMLIYARDESALAAQGVRWREEKPGVSEALQMAARIWQESEGDHAEATNRWRAWMREFKRQGVATDAVTRFTSLDENGRPIFTGQNISWPGGGGPRFDVLHPVTGRPVQVPKTGWRYTEEDMRRRIDLGLVRFGADETSGVQGVSLLEDMTEWVAGSTFDVDRRRAPAHLERVLGAKRFPFPKDHEVLMRWIRLAAPKDAVVLDFFGGAGTTTEAVLRLNAEDGGTRRSVLVTNNEVGSTMAKKLRKKGLRRGDPEWEALGVFEHVTRPRITAVVTGERPDGTAYDQTVEGNVEFFSLAYLEPGSLRRGAEFAAIAPVLWLENGARGDRIDADPGPGWAITDTYGVLFDMDSFGDFVDAVEDHGGIHRVYVVTDSPAQARAVGRRLPASVSVTRLYDDLIDRQGGRHS
ncbi:MAG: site-specific DNA-methyltransferase [Aeromicrobium sp.]|uniref:site-specific DNA-methyltransferase n=1 Tax=Aeromicrobium sp. TaxID=1871063 RepID=UPI00263751A7|nr:site-specific DNA-methyltransferase [Aeromicrobium sp.]MDF1704638.1 site-specific DNA-methyltransferase [Aeromicrobium sp.]